LRNLLLKTYYSPHQIQSRLLKLAGLFLSIYALALTLSPAARTDSWATDLRWSHWIGLGIWIIFAFFIHRQTTRQIPDADPYLFPATALLAGWGLITIWRLDSGFGLRQSLWLAVCGVVFLVGLRLPHNLDVLRRYKYVFLSSGLFLTALTLIFGSNPGGSGPRMWLGCCGLYLQPSEPLKLLLIVYLAAYFSDRIPIRTRLFPLLLPTFFLTGLALAILLIQRDLGTASIFIFLYATTVYMASGKRRLLLVSMGILALTGVVGYYFVDIIRYRLIAWIDPWTDPSGRSYQVIQSILAVANGGLFGRGPGMGTPGLVPVAHSDFIFTSIAEEAGLVGTFALLGILALIATRGFLIAIRAASNFRRLLAAGIATYFGAQSILIIGGNLRLLPLTGVTLPFVSYGGSSLLTSFIGLLLLMQISNEVDEEPAPLPSPQPYLHIAALIWVGLLACGAINSWWANLRSDDLLTRTDNPRRAIADRFVLRGTILDRQNRPITTTTGKPGNYSRFYVVPELSAVAGYTHPIYGQAGLEASLDPYLRGLQGNPALLIWWDHLLYGQPPAGLNVRLSLDIDIQKRADELLGNHAGALVLINAQTGEILAMASHPTFDANQLDSIGPTLQTSLDGPLLNRATQGQYTIDSAISPLINAAFPQGTPGNSDLLNFYDRLGFYNTPDLRLPSVPAAPRGTTRDLSISPVQMASAVAGLSNQGLCPASQIASAVETPLEGWVVLPSPGNPIRCLPVDGVSQVTEKLQSKGNLFWEFTSNGTEKNLPVTWYLAGTLSNWSGTPLAIVVILEANNPVLTQNIGREVLKKAIQP
jgi:cell division protein FtsW (lipid II flippase)